MFQFLRMKILIILTIILLSVPCFCTSSPLVTTAPQTQPGDLTDCSDSRAPIADLLVGLFEPGSECALEIFVDSYCSS